MRLLWVDPIGTDAFRAPTLRLLRDACASDTGVEFVSLPPGRPLDLERPEAEAIVTPDIVTIVRKSASEYDGIFIGCFFDTALAQARAVANGCFVTGPGDATTRMAQESGSRYSIIVGDDSWSSRVRRNAETYGTADLLASIRPAGVSVAELASPSAATLDALERAGRRAIEEDGAALLIVGCTADLASHKALEARLKVPVLDAIAAPFAWMEREVRRSQRMAVPQPAR